MAVTFGGFSRSLFAAFGIGGVGNPAHGEQLLGPVSSSTESGVTVNDTRALQISTVWACIRIRTNPVASMPLGIFKRTESGREAMSDGWLHDLFKVSPNAAMSPLAFRRAMQMQLVAWGNAYALIGRSGERVTSLNPILPEFMEVKRDGNDVQYVYQTKSGPVTFAKEEVFHLKGFSPDGIVGLSPLAYARQAMGLSVSAEKYASYSYSKNGRPPGYIKFDKVLTPQQREDAKAIYQGVSVDSTGTWILEGGAEYKTTGLPPDDMQMLESRRFQIAELCRYYGVPSHLVNDMEKSSSWGTGIEQQNLGFLQYTIDADLKEWESAIANQLLTRSQRRELFVEHNVEGLLRSDSAGRASFYSQMAQNGIMSRNEIRKKENLPPVDGGDELTVQVNLTPVDELQKVNGNAEQNRQPA